MSILLRSVVTVIDVFYKYTSQDGECGTLSKDELKELLQKEFRPILKVRNVRQDRRLPRPLRSVLDEQIGAQKHTVSMASGQTMSSTSWGHQKVC